MPIPVNRPAVNRDDIESVLQTLRDTWISGESPTVSDFEASLALATDSSHAIALSSGTAACDAVSQALGLGPSSTVVAPATTIISTVSHAARLGSQIHVVDVDPQSWCIDVQAVDRSLADDPAAIFAVHLFGLSADMKQLTEVAAPRGVKIIEDAAEALGQFVGTRPCGSMGTAGIFSFYANKVVTSGEGGAVVTSDDALADEIRRIRNLYFDPAERFVHEELGFNFRMSGTAAALASSQLKRLPSLIARKRQIGMRYLSNLEGHPWLELPLSEWNGNENSFWVFAVVLRSDAPLGLAQVRSRLLELGVDTRRFFFPLNRQPALLKRGLVSGTATPVADSLWERGFYLPSGVGTTDDEVDEVSQHLWDLA